MEYSTLPCSSSRSGEFAAVPAPSIPFQTWFLRVDGTVEGDIQQGAVVLKGHRLPVDAERGHFNPSPFVFGQFKNAGVNGGSGSLMVRERTSIMLPGWNALKNRWSTLCQGLPPVVSEHHFHGAAVLVGSGVHGDVHCVIHRLLPTRVLGNASRDRQNQQRKSQRIRFGFKAFRENTEPEPFTVFRTRWPGRCGKSTCAQRLWGLRGEQAVPSVGWNLLHAFIEG